MTILSLITDAVEDLGDCTTDAVFAAIRSEVPKQTRRSIAPYLYRAARKGLIRQVQSGKHGPGSAGGVLAPVGVRAFAIPRVRSVFDLGAQQQATP